MEIKIQNINNQAEQKNVKRFYYFIRTLVGICFIPCLIPFAIFLLSLIDKDLAIIEILKNQAEEIALAMLMSIIGLFVVLFFLCLLISIILTLMKKNRIGIIG